MRYEATKIRIYPNETQETYLKKSCGISRLSYNWALAQWKTQYDLGLKPSEGALRKHFNSIKREQYPFVMEVSKCVPQQAIKNLGKAFDSFFKNCKKKSGKALGYPKFKKKNGSKDSFYLDSGHFRLSGKTIRFPHLDDPIALAYDFEQSGKLISSTITRDCDRWYVSIIQELPDFEAPLAPKNTVGVDLGIKKIAVLSDGYELPSDQLLKVKTKRLARLQRALAKKQKGSANRLKAKQKLAKLHSQIKHRRLDVLHQLTTKLVKEYQTVVIEDLNVSGMVKNHNLARSISNVGFGMFRTLITYKCSKYKRDLIVAPRFYASSKLCSGCGNKKEDLKLSDRTYDCQACGIELCRDLNASKNLEKLGTCCPDVKPVEFLSDVGNNAKDWEAGSKKLIILDSGISSLSRTIN